MTCWKLLAKSRCTNLILVVCLQSISNPLPLPLVILLLCFFTTILRHGYMPKAFRDCVLVPILKGSKDASCTVVRTTELFVELFPHPSKAFQTDQIRPSSSSCNFLDHSSPADALYMVFIRSPEHKVTSLVPTPSPASFTELTHRLSCLLCTSSYHHMICMSSRAFAFDTHYAIACI